jgi:hypothetical protein
MLRQSLLLLSAALTISAAPIIARQTNGSSVALNPTISKDLVNQLELAGTSVGRFTIIKAQGPAYYKYDFNPDANSKTTDGGTFIGEGGQGVLANRAKFPALTNLGIAFSMGFMNPCGMNTPHVHPRATEVLTIADVAEGGIVRTGFSLENGIASQFSTELSKYQGTVFPQGSVHYEFNDNCAPATFIAGFNSDDPGLSSIAQNFFDLDPDIVEADLGFPREINGMNIAQFAPTIPPSFALGIQSCLDRCGITYVPFNATA